MELRFIMQKPFIASASSLELPGAKRTIIPPEGKIWKPGSIYEVEVAFFTTNPKFVTLVHVSNHSPLFFRFILLNNTPLYFIDKMHYMKALREIYREREI